jgi:trehalose 2-sulfotransferase
MADVVQRIDALDLMSEQFDAAAPEPVTRKLIVCAAPRSGSYRLSRLMHAADLGIPLEYFNPRFVPAFCKRWGVPLGEKGLPDVGQYAKVLMQRRVHRGLFCTKLQYWQFDPLLRNETGRALFDGAVVIHLMRADVQMQSFSLQAALATGRWEFTDRTMVAPQFSAGELADVQRVAKAIDVIVAEDARWRTLFAFAGMRPLLITLDDLVERAEETVERIAGRLGMSFNRESLRGLIAVDEKYRINQVEIAKIKDAVAGKLAELAFQPRPRSGGQRQI